METIKSESLDFEKKSEFEIEKRQCINDNNDIEQFIEHQLHDILSQMKISDSSEVNNHLNKTVCQNSDDLLDNQIHLKNVINNEKQSDISNNLILLNDSITPNSKEVCDAVCDPSSSNKVVGETSINNKESSETFLNKSNDILSHSISKINEFFGNCNKNKNSSNAFKQSDQTVVVGKLLDVTLDSSNKSKSEIIIERENSNENQLVTITDEIQNSPLTNSNERKMNVTYENINISPENNGFSRKEENETDSLNNNCEMVANATEEVFHDSKSEKLNSTYLRNESEDEVKEPCVDNETTNSSNSTTDSDGGNQNVTVILVNPKKVQNTTFSKENKLSTLTPMQLIDLDEIEILKKENSQLKLELASKQNQHHEINKMLHEFDAKMQEIYETYLEERQARLSIQSNLDTLELAFNDLLQKYEKSKTYIKIFKDNENILKTNVQILKEKMDEERNKYGLFKSYAENRIDLAHKENIKTQQNYDTLKKTYEKLQKCFVPLNSV